MHDVAWRCDMNNVRSKDAHKQSARTSLSQQYNADHQKTQINWRTILFRPFVKVISNILCIKKKKS